jgi:hypothetical protein
MFLISGVERNKQKVELEKYKIELCVYILITEHILVIGNWFLVLNPGT